MIEIKKEEKGIKEAGQTHISMCLFVPSAAVFMKFIISMVLGCRQLIIKIFQDIDLKKLNV